LIAAAGAGAVSVIEIVAHRSLMPGKQVEAISTLLSVKNGPRTASLSEDIGADCE